jgi:ribosomal protein L37AE/L43A
VKKSPKCPKCGGALPEYQVEASGACKCGHCQWGWFAGETFYATKGGKSVL